MSKMTKDQIDALMLAIGFAIGIAPTKRPSMLRLFFEWLAVSSALIAVAMIVIYLFLGAAIQEQEFQDNIRFSRCERMDDIERNAMKGYCQ